MAKRKKRPIYANEDFLASSLPHSRKDQFKFIFKTRKPLFLLIGLFLVLFSLPLLVSTLFLDFTINNAYNLFQSGEITESSFYAFFYTDVMVFGIAGAILFLVFTVGLSGVFEILKKLIFSQPIFFWYDFRQGIKKNVKGFLGISAFAAFFVILLSVLFRFVGPTFWFLITTVFFILFVYPIIVGLFVYKTFYEASFAEALRNGVQLFVIVHVKGILISLGFAIVPIVTNVLSALLVMTPMVSEFINIAYMLFVAPWYLLFVFSFYYSVLDENINKDNFEYYYLKGLYHSSREEDEYENKIQG
ncbi:MAG: hypothetical protein MJ239_01645 [Bacilli bacterium]|nr:hypothetical protein [Bacilli bacterium]